MIAALDHPHGEPLDVRILIRPLRRRMATTLVAHRVIAAAAAILIGIATIFFLDRVLPWPGTTGSARIAIAAMAYALAILIGTGIRIAMDWPTIPATIQHVDRELGLKNRLSTAYEHRNRADRMAALQRAELQRLLVTTRLVEAVTIRLPRRLLGLFALGLMLLGLALASPSSRGSAHSQNSDVLAITRHAATAAGKLLDHLGNSAASTRSTAPAQSLTSLQIKNVLQNLQKQLASAQSQHAALRALSTAQDNLQKIATGAAQARGATQSLASALRQGPTQQVAHALQAGDPGAVKQSLQSLSRQLASMSPAQRLAAARALERAANVAPAALKQTLRQAAFSLTDNNPAGASVALKSAASQAAQLQQQANADRSAQQAAVGVQKIQSDAANGATDNSAINCPTASAGNSGSIAAACEETPVVGAAASPQARGSGQSASSPPASSGSPVSKTATGAGTGRRSRKSSSPGSGASQRGSTGAASASSGSATTHSGQSALAGTASRAGQAAGATVNLQSPSTVGSASTSASTSGQSGSGSGSGSKGTAGSGSPGRATTVYVPGAQLKGPGVTEAGPLGSTVEVGSPSYEQMVEKYATSANAALGREAVPPGIQDAIKRYFSTLQGAR